MNSLLQEKLAHLFHPRQSNLHRAKILHPDSLAIVIVLLSILGLGIKFGLHKIGGAILGYSSEISVASVVAQTNSARESQGIAALTVNPKLEAAARAKAQDMLSKQYWSHKTPEGVDPWLFIQNQGYSYQVAGENLAKNFQYTSQMVTAWLNSPTHRANLLNPRYQEIGVAVVNGTLQNTETTLVVQFFGTAAAPKTAEIAAAETVSVDLSAVENEESAPATNDETESQPEAVVEEPAPVLAAQVAPEGKLAPIHYYQPLSIIKSIVASILLLILLALLYDWYAVSHHQKARIVGKNLAHFMLLYTVLLITFLINSGKIL